MTEPGQGTTQGSEASECLPCRGTGQVISQLGGAPSTVRCPWCEGTGQRIAGVDAQQHWQGHGGSELAGGDGSQGARGQADPPAQSAP